MDFLFKKNSTKTFFFLFGTGLEFVAFRNKVISSSNLNPYSFQRESMDCKIIQKNIEIITFFMQMKSFFYGQMGELLKT